MKQVQQVTGIELFAGAGGQALGFSQAGIYHDLLVENDKDCINTLRANSNWSVRGDDIRDIDFKHFDRLCTDVVSGSFPCQAFSYAGKRLGFDDVKGTLFYEFARAVDQIEPDLFITENVAGLVTHDNGQTFQTILDVLGDIGDYKIQYQVLNAVNYNVPQKRKRIFIVGHLPHLDFKFPEPNDYMFTVQHALRDVPRSTGASYSDTKRDVMVQVPPGGCWIDLPEDVQREYMGKSYHSSGGRRGIAHRLSWTKPCPTLTTSPAQKLTERCHPVETRPLTVREYARIQTFPDDWVFSGSVSSQYKQIGNAVPVELARRLGRCIIRAVRP